MLIRLFPFLFCIVAPLTSFLNCGFWGFIFFFIFRVFLSWFFFFLFFQFFFSSLRGTFYASFFPGLVSGFKFSLSQASACSWSAFSLNSLNWPLVPGLGEWLTAG